MKGPEARPPKFTTLTDALRAASDSRAGLTFLDAHGEETPLPFATLHGRAGMVARALVERGVRPGDRVALVLPTSPGFMDAFFGTLLAGAVAVPLYPPVRLGRLEEYHARTAAMLRACGARIVLTDARIRRLLGQAVSRARPALGCVEIGELFRPGRPVEVATTPAALAIIQFSSGTTVEPKPVALSHANVLANLAALDSFVPEDGGLRPSGVSWLPLYHDMGLIGCLLLAVYHPGPLTLIPPELFISRPAVWLRAISRKRATISVAPNFAFNLCTRRVRDEEMEGVDLSAWRIALNGAEPVAPNVLRRFAERFGRWGFNPVALTPVYGLAEATLAVTFSRPDAPFVSRNVDPSALARTGEALDGGRELASVGTPLPGVEVEVRDADGRELPEGRVGGVFVRGPSVMTGYFGAPQATAAALRDGWLDTGDLGFVSGGELYLCGRAKDVVILRGANHAPQEFEDPLEHVAGLRPGCAVAIGFVPEGADGEELAILAEHAPDERPEADLDQRVRAAVVERTGIRPHTVRILEPGTLPRTSSGKLRRNEAKRRFLENELAPPDRVTTLTLASALIRSRIALARTKPTG